MDKHYQEIQDRMCLDRQNYKGPYCCFDMDSMLNKEEAGPIYKIGYYTHTREYYLESIEGYVCYIQFCPWCGSHLPKSLCDEWFDILEREYGLDDPGWPEQKEKVPAAFFTDEWWKKRNL